jgi:hypothetical protein
VDRRNFICAITAAAGSAACAEAPKETTAVRYAIAGFTCVTCAVGLEVLLRQQRGVVRADASYPEQNVAIGFDQTVISEKALKDFIGQCGFAAV